MLTVWYISHGTSPKCTELLAKLVCHTETNRKVNNKVLKQLYRNLPCLDDFARDTVLSLD